MNEKEKLLKAIKDADRAYYDEDAPTISDASYDALRKEYIDEYGSEDLDYTPGSVLDSFQRFHHPIPVTSLAKIKDGENDKLHKWKKKLAPIVLEPKYDGLTVVAYPQKDGSFKYVTRGSGTDGEVLPHFIHKYEGNQLSSGAYGIRGEVFLTKTAFDRIQKDKKAKGEEPFKNIRNAAAGILRSKERSPYINELSYIAYDVVGWDVGEQFKIDYIIDHTPFTPTATSKVYLSDTPDEAIWEKARDMYTVIGEEVPLDGIVMKTTQNGTLAKYGTTGHHPNNSVAIKPSRQLFKTMIRDIEFSTGRTKITPVAIFDPVIIDDTEVTRASIHNRDYFDKMALRRGDTVYVYKSNEIIPQIDSVIHGDGELIPWPEEKESEKDLFVRDVMHFVSKPVLDIKGFSRKTAEKVYDYMHSFGAHCDSPTVIFSIGQDEYASIPGMGETSAHKLCVQLQRLIDNGIVFPRFVRALCIPGIGANVGELLEKKFHSQKEFEEKVVYNDSYEYFKPDNERIAELMEIDGIGKTTAETIISYEFKEAYDDLKAFVRPIFEEIKTGSIGKFTGMNFVLTGKMPQKRSYYENMIREAGGEIQSSVNNKTTYLVIADPNSQSTKAKKARDLGTKLISPEELESFSGWSMPRFGNTVISKLEKSVTRNKKIEGRNTFGLPN